MKGFFVKKLTNLMLFAIIAILFLCGCNRSIPENGPVQASSSDSTPVMVENTDDLDSLPLDTDSRTTGEYLLEVDKLLDEDKFKEALQVCQTAGKKDPNHPSLNMYMGICYYDMGLYETAVKCFNKSLELEKSATENYLHRGMAYIKLGKYESAIEDFNRIMKYTKDFFVIYNARGTAYALKGELEKALKDFDEAVKLEPEYEVQRENRGLALLLMGKTAEALKEMKKGVEINPRYADGYESVALGYIVAGKTDMARNLLEKHADLLKDKPMGHYIMGYILNSEKNSAESEKYYHEGMTLDRLKDDYTLAKSLTTAYPSTAVGKIMAEIVKAIDRLGGIQGPQETPADPSR